MADWFLNPGYLAAAAALISVPIIIHLINRMRFKRIRWAAMEFLLKAILTEKVFSPSLHILAIIVTHIT